MYDGASRSDAPVLQRAVGELRVAVKRARDGRTVLDGLRQAGCLKARFPRPRRCRAGRCRDAEHVGGVAGGDRLDSRDSRCGTGARATIAAQAAERFYRALPGSAPSHVRTHITVATGAARNGCRRRPSCSTTARSTGAWRSTSRPMPGFSAWRCLVFGRTAMGERVEQASLRDLIQVRRGGDLLLHDAIRLDGEIDATLQRAGDRRRRPCRGDAGARCTGCAKARWTPMRGCVARSENGVSAVERYADCAHRCGRRCLVARGGDCRTAGAACRTASCHAYGYVERRAPDEPDAARERQTADHHGRDGCATPAGARREAEPPGSGGVDHRFRRRGRARRAQRRRPDGGGRQGD